MNIGNNFLRLPFTFDAERLAAEAGALPDCAWMHHPSRMSGNTAVALISRNGGDNDDFDGRMQATPHLFKSPYIRQVLASFDEVLGRSRLMKLAAGSEVSAHVDFNYHWYTRLRIHVPVISNPDVIFHCANDAIHMQAGECWIFDSWRRHWVVNAGNEDRIHLVFDTAGSADFWQRVERLQSADAAPVTARQLPFDAAAEPNVRTERYNVSPIMSPGELDALIAELIRDFEGNAANDAALVARYRRQLITFTKDWREVWLEYGFERVGWARYQAAIDRLTASLHRNPRALTTASNDVGVNPIIMQRILRPALAVDKMSQFLADIDPGS